MGQDLNGRQVNSVTNHTVAATLLDADNGTRHTTVGAGGAVALTLPAALPGRHFAFRVGAAQELRITPAASGSGGVADTADSISLPSTGVPGAAGKYLTANALGELVMLECFVAGNWDVTGYTGTWTAEA